jgi:hypothetical protein
LSRIDRGTDAKVDRARTRASSVSPRAKYIGRLRAGATRRNVAFLASLFALSGAAVAVAAPGGTTVADNPTDPGSPGLAQVGPVAKNGFPAWYKDKNNIRLEPCLDSGDPLCIMGALANPDQPVDVDNVKGNFPDEFFYQATNAGLDNVGKNVGTAAKPRFGRASLVASLEGAFANAQAPGEQMVFARLRLRVTDGLEGGTNYMFVQPYGERTIQTDAGSGELFVTEDIGTVAGNFTDALKGRIAPFLKWDDSAPEAPAGYIGDPNVDHPITGGVNNYFAIIGPGVGANKVADPTSDCPTAIAKANAVNNDPNTPADQKIHGTGPDGSLSEADCIYTNLFSLMGKMAENAGVTVNDATFSRDADGNTSVDVQAESDANQNIVVRPTANRTAATRLFSPTKLTEDQGGHYYAHIKMESAKDFPSGSANQVEVLNATDGNPQDAKTVTPVDEILNATASYNNTPDDSGARLLTVTAESSDKKDPVTLSVDDPNGGAPVDLKVPADAPAGSTAQTGTLTLPAAPRTVTITSSKGGKLTIPVHTDIASDSTPAPLAATIRGPVKAVTTGAAVKLFGTGSTGPIKAYSWTGPFTVDPADGSVTGTAADGVGGAITAGADTDTATLTSPTTAGSYGYKLEVTDDDGKTAAATTILTVTDGGAAPGVLGDPLTPGKTRYTENQGRMVIDGTATVRTSNKVLIWFANRIPADPAHTKPDATAIVDPVSGAWAYDTGRGGMPTPPNADCVSYISTHGDPAVVGGANTPSADVWNCVPIDGRKLTAPLPVAGDPPAADPGAGPAGAAAAGAGAAGAGPVAAAVPGLGARIAVAAARVAAPATVTAAAFGTTGVPVSVTVPQGATLVRLRVLTTANTPLFSTFKKVKGGTTVKVKVKSAKLRKQLRAGKRIVIEARAGTAKNRLGKATRKIVRVR